MNDLWANLLPLGVGSALPPVQTILTILLLRSSGGRLTAVAWIAGMTAVRLLQGVVFGLVLGADTGGQAGASGPGPIGSTLLLVVAILLYVSAGKHLVRQNDDDAPPAWMATAEEMKPGRALLVGAGLMAVGVKFWVFTLAAISVIEEAQLGQPGATVAFLGFIALAQSIHLVILAVAFVLPSRSQQVLGRVADSLQRNSRVIMIAFGLVFGTWFLGKALNGLGVL